MRLSVWPTARHDWPTWLRLARHAETTGWDGLWMGDHFMDNNEVGGGDINEAFAYLAAAAATVPRLRLGSLVAGNTYRHPAVLANQAATIDQISGGRFTLGLGAGWQVNEHRQYGIELPAPGPLLRRFDEACQVVRGLLDEDRFSFDGEFYQLTDATMEPKPAERMPLMIGGSGEKVMPGIVARRADQWNIWSTPAEFARKNAIITAACEKEGRDPATLRRTTQALIFIGPDAEERVEHLRGSGRPVVLGTRAQLMDTIGAWAEAGVEELIVPDGHLRDPDLSIELFDLIRDVASTLNT